MSDQDKLKAFNEEEAVGRLHRQDRTKLTDVLPTDDAAEGSPQDVLNKTTDETAVVGVVDRIICEIEVNGESTIRNSRGPEVVSRDRSVEVPIAFNTNTIKLIAHEPNGIGSLYHILGAGPQGTPISIPFQCGPIKEYGINGVSTEELITVALHRMQTINKAFPSRENSQVITKLEEALLWSAKRTIERTAAGTEGTSKQ